MRARFTFFMKWALRLAGVFLVLLLVAIGWVYTHKGDIMNMLKKGLNEQLQAPVDIAQLDIDLWAAFPKVSLKMSNVFSAGYGAQNGDTLLQLRHVYLAANLWKLFQGEYRVEKLIMEGGSLHIKEAGNLSNYLIWKSETASTSEVQFEISEVVLSNISFRYSDSDIYTSTFVQNGRLDLQLSHSQNAVSYDLSLEGLAYQSEPYSTQFREAWSGTGNVLWSGEDYQIELSKTKLTWMDLSGKIKMNPVDKHILSLSGKIIHPENTLRNLAPEYIHWLEDYGLSGQIDYQLMWEENNALPLKLSLAMSGGELQARAAKTSLSNLQFEAEIVGNPEKYSSYQLRVAKGHFEMSGQSATFSGTLRNPEMPFLQFTADLSGSMSELQAFVAWPMVHFEDGRGKLKMDFSHQFKNWPPNQAGDFKGADIKGSLLLTEADFTLEGLEEAFSNTEARFVFDQQSLVAEQLKGMVGSSDFEGNGYIDQFFAYLFADQPLKLVANIHFGKLDMLPFFADSVSDSDFKMPDYIQADLRLQVEKLSFANFNATEVETRIQQKAGMLTAEIRSMKSCGGTGTGTVLFKQAENGFYLKVNAAVKNIDMPQMLLAFDHFGQSTFTADNMKGRADAQIVFEDLLDARLNPILDKITCTAQLKITNGQLIDFEPLNSLSAFISLDELRDVKFSDLENVIQIKNGQMIIPEMNIKSTALNFSTRGVHDFDNNIEYFVKLQMNEMLFRKQVKKQPDLEEHITVEDHSPSPYLHFKITGNVDHPVVAYDMQGAKRGVRDKWVDEQKTFKAVIKEEFKKDSTAVKETPVNYTIEWGEENNDEEEPDF